MKKGHKKVLIIFISAALLLAGYFVFFEKKTPSKKPAPAKESDPADQSQPEPPEAGEAAIQPEKKSEEPVKKEEPSPEIPEKFLLEIHFYSQAPFSRWDAFDEDMCEEASVLNAVYYLLDKKPSLEKYEEDLKAMQKTEKEELGGWKSTTASDVKKLVGIYFDGEIKSKIIDNPTIEDIESEIAAGRPVVVPLSGRDIGNPNFKAPGPVYHMLTVKGYDAQNFITNDVGTRKGNSYAYKKEVIMKNMHDWNEKDIHLGEKRVLVLYK